MKSLDLLSDPTLVHWALMQDNAQLHVARVCREFLDATEWPRCSVWLKSFLAPMGDYICVHPTALIKPQIAHQLTDAAFQVWYEIPEDLLTHQEPVLTLSGVHTGKLAPNRLLS